MAVPLISNAPQLLTPTQRAAATLMAEGKTLKEIAPLVGVTERTLVNWRAIPIFMREVYDIQTQRLEASTGTEYELLPEIIEILKGIVRGYETTEEGERRNLMTEHTERIQAAKVLIQASGEYRIRQLLERKISDLESRIELLIAQGSERRDPDAHYVDVDGTPLDDEDEDSLFGFDEAEHKALGLEIVDEPKSKEIPNINEPPPLPPSAPLTAEGSFLDNL